MRKKLLVVIVTYNAMNWIDKCISSLKKSTYPNDVFIVDNGSSDGTQEYIRLKYTDCCFFQSPENLGFGRANNLGFKYAIDHNYDFVYLLNQDAWVDDKTFENMISYMQSNMDYGILSPIQMQANREHFDNNFGLLLKDDSYMLYENLLLNNSIDVINVPKVMGAHWLLSRKCIQKVGGFSPTFRHYGEDDNYCDRVKFHNLKIGILPSALAVHDREYRVDPVKKQVYLFYVKGLVQLSGWNYGNNFHIFIRLLYLAFKKDLFHSVLYIRMIVKLFSNRRSICSNKNMSAKDFAFL